MIVIKLRVLLIDDDLQACEQIASALAADAFFLLQCCAAGRRRRDAMLQWRPDLILLDLHAPARQAAEFIAALRADRRTAPVPVVLLAAASPRCDRASKLVVGAAGLIEKPIDPATLPAQLRRFVAVEGILASVRDSFFQRLARDASTLRACGSALRNASSGGALARIGEIAHALSGAGGIYGFAGISCESAALAEAAAAYRIGAPGLRELQRALDRVLDRISPR